MPRAKFTLELFWSRVERRSPDECWPWTMCTDGRYGRVEWDKHHLKAHRAAWELTHGEIPSDLFVLHKCDNPICCNPDHLFLGTHQDNMDDRARKGRQNHGTKNALSTEQVLFVRQHPERSIKSLALELGVSRHVIYGVRSGRRYGNVT